MQKFKYCKEVWKTKMTKAERMFKIYVDVALTTGNLNSKDY